MHCLTFAKGHSRFYKKHLQMSHMDKNVLKIIFFKLIYATKVPGIMVTVPKNKGSTIELLLLTTS